MQKILKNNKINGSILAEHQTSK